MTKLTPKGLPEVSLDTIDVFIRDHNTRMSEEKRIEFYSAIFDQITVDNPNIHDLFDVWDEQYEITGDPMYISMKTGAVILYELLVRQAESNELDDLVK